MCALNPHHRAAQRARVPRPLGQTARVEDVVARGLRGLAPAYLEADRAVLRVEEGLHQRVLRGGGFRPVVVVLQAVELGVVPPGLAEPVAQVPQHLAPFTEQVVGGGNESGRVASLAAGVHGRDLAQQAFHQRPGLRRREARFGGSGVRRPGRDQLAVLGHGFQVVVAILKHVESRAVIVQILHLDVAEPRDNVVKLVGHVWTRISLLWC